MMKQQRRTYHPDIFVDKDDFRLIREQRHPLRRRALLRVLLCGPFPVLA